MNARQSRTWKEIVRQCASNSYNSINVASKTRSDAIAAVDALVELATPELAELLERMASLVHSTPSTRQQRRASALAAKIRGALDDSKT